MTDIYLAIGSNISPASHVRLAVNELRQKLGGCICSPVYNTAAVGFDGPDFYNLVLKASTPLALKQVQTITNGIEKTIGKSTPFEKFRSREIDIDLLLYGDVIIARKDFTLPRTDILKYAFMLKPLSDIAPDLMHPTEGRTMSDLWDSFDPKPNMPIVESLSL